MYYVTYGLAICFKFIVTVCSPVIRRDPILGMILTARIKLDDELPDLFQNFLTGICRSVAITCPFMARKRPPVSLTRDINRKSAGNYPATYVRLRLVASRRGEVD